MPAKASKLAAESTGDAPVYTYEVEKETFDERLRRSLPDDARLVIVTAKRYPASKFARHFKVKRRSGVVIRPQSGEPSIQAEVSHDAYRPDAKARALLRGVELVEQDLRSSGGAYSLAEVQTLMHGISRQAVNSRVREGNLLAVPGPSNRAYYPAVQFKSDGKPVDGLKEVRQALGTKNAWMMLNFLVSAEPKLNGRKPIEMMKAGELDKVLEVARRFGVQGT